jgi:hypothetical protein
VSRRGDDVFEMPRRRPIDDQAVESLLVGDPTTNDLDGLSAFVDDVRAVAAGPMPVPSLALDHVLTRGFSTDKGDLPATAASNADGSAMQTAGPPKWRRALMKTSQFVAGLSMAAKVALGAGVAVAATAGAAAAGVLPGPVQGAVADAVGTVTPFELPGGSGGGSATDGATAGAPVDPGTTTTTAAPAAGTGSTGTPSAGTPSSSDGTAVVPGAPGGSTNGAPGGSTGAPAGDPQPPSVAPVTEPSTSPPAGDPGPVDEPKVPQTLSIQCSVTGDHHVGCSWTGADPANFGRYLLLRTSSDGKAGRVLVQSGDIAATTWDDSLALTPGVTYGYMVLVQAPDGTSVTHSQYVYVTP